MLEMVDLDASLDKETYQTLQDALDVRLGALQRELKAAGIPLVVVFEGWDASGKGDLINRLLRPLDPRLFKVQATSQPTAEETLRPPMWRFWRTLPNDGDMAIYDRSWYRQVLDDRVDGVIPQDACGAAYDRIRTFERQLADHGAVIVKFWLHISPEEQLSRFQARERTPHKSWKITPDDWRNREKWDDYWAAVSDMIERTSTVEAPWTIVEGNDKRHARLKTLETVIAAIEERL